MSKHLKYNSGGAVGIYQIMEFWQTQAVYSNLQLFSRKNESDLIHLNSFLFLKSLLHSKNLILWLEIERLFTTR